MPARPAKAGDVCFLVACRCEKPVLVNKYFLATWRCTCRAKGLKKAWVTLGPKGAIPPPDEWEWLPEPQPIR